MPKKKIIFVVPTSLQQELRERVIKDGYGFRGKSKWVAEAIDRLLTNKKFPEFVNYSDEMSNFDKRETVVIEASLYRKLQDAILLIRKEFPLLEGVKSHVVRTAILQRLVRT